MTEMRQLLRYEIPGLLVLIYTSLMILPFVEPWAMKSLVADSHFFSIAFAVIALPLGWLIYQVYDTTYPKHYRKNSPKLLENLVKESGKPLFEKWIEENTFFEQLVNFFKISI
jgi:hypothetical protein